MRIAIVPDHARLCLNNLRSAPIAGDQPPLARKRTLKSDLLCLVFEAKEVLHDIAGLYAQRRLMEDAPARNRPKVREIVMT